MRLFLAVAITLMAAHANATWLLEYGSQPGDYIGQGGSGTVTDAQGTLTVTANANHVEFSYLNLPAFWSADFSAPSGQSLSVGTYSSVERYPFNSAGTAGLSVDGDGRGCNRLYGSFKVLEVAFDAGNNLTKFAADFVQHCENFEPAMYGGIRYNSTVPVTLTAPVMPPASLSIRTNDGISFSLVRPQAYFLDQDQSPALQVIVDAPTNVLPTHHVLMLFAAPSGQSLGVRNYANAASYDPSGSSPSFTVQGWTPSSTLFACSSNANSWFNILEMVRGPDGTYSKLAVDFQQQCATGSSTITYGSLRINSSVAYVPPATHTARVSPSGTTSLAPGEYGPNLVSRALDDSNRPVPGATVTFTSPCGTFNGASSVNVIADSSGTATSPQLRGSALIGTCTVQARVAGGSTDVGQDFPVNIFDPATVHASFSPPSYHFVLPDQTTAAITFTITDHNGAPIPGLKLAEGGTSCSSGQPCFTLDDPSPWTTDIHGQYVFHLRLTNSTLGDALFQVYLQTRLDAVATASLNISGLTRPSYQGMWWVGPQENGTGMAVIQHGDRMFASLYVYDANGKPTWYAMPGGTWNSDHTQITGSLYLPAGTPFFSYDASRLIVGNPAGTITIGFQSLDHATVDYVIGGVAGHKLMQAEIFASGSTAVIDDSDLWWGGASQNGWGITIVQQAQTLFPIWYTYNEIGKPTWYAMPGGTWTAADTYEGHVYRTAGSTWLGTSYDPSLLQVFDVGTYRIQFVGDSATFTYTVDGHSGTLQLVREPF